MHQNPPVERTRIRSYTSDNVMQQNMDFYSQVHTIQKGVTLDGVIYPTRLHPAEIITKASVKSAWRYQPSTKDIFVVSFPGSGTTWMIQMIHQIMVRGKCPKETQNVDDIYTCLETKDPDFVKLFKIQNNTFHIFKTHQLVRHQVYSSQA